MTHCTVKKLIISDSATNGNVDIYYTNESMVHHLYKKAWEIKTHALNNVREEVRFIGFGKFPFSQAATNESKGILSGDEICALLTRHNKKY